MKVDRLMSIVMVLLDKKRVNAKHLAEMFEVSLRTIYRDIDAIDLAGIPVIATSGVGGGFEILPSYKLDNKVFSSADLSAILSSLSSMNHMMQGDDLIHALAKVKSFIPEQHAEEIDLKVNQIRIDLSPWMGNSSVHNHLELIKQALDMHCLVSFEYRDRHSITSKRTVEAYQLILKNSQWYVQAFCLSRKDYRLFRLSRMMDLVIEKTSFIPREYESPQLDFTEHIQSLSTKIKLRIHQSALDRVLEFCALDDIEKTSPNHYELWFPFIENSFHYNILLGFGDQCECLEPAHVREELRKRINKMALLYRENT